MVGKQTQSEKKVIARSRATYRGVTIWETADGCAFFIGTRQFDCLDLDEATAGIDAMYAMAEKKMTGVGDTGHGQ